MSEIEQNYNANHLRKIQPASDKMEVKRASLHGLDAAGFSLTSDYEAYQGQDASSPSTSGMLSGMRDVISFLLLTYR
jgi:hypothetical protein